MQINKCKISGSHLYQHPKLDRDPAARPSHHSGNENDFEKKTRSRSSRTSELCSGKGGSPEKKSQKLRTFSISPLTPPPRIYGH